MEEMRQQSEKAGTQIVNDMIIDVDFKLYPFVAIGDNGDKYLANSIIIATGAQAKWLGLESEKKFMGFGVSGCATCDGFFYKNKEVIVIGGGNTAVEEALYLTNHASKVILVHRRDALRAEKILQDRLFKHPKIQIIWDSALEEVLGSENPLSVEGAKIKNLKTGNISNLKVDGIFIAIGHKPNTGLFKGKLDMDEEGYIITHPDSTKTNVEGVFAAGDVQDKIFRQAVTAAGTGCMASLEALKFIESK
jgi:thioredoxin reductase (NADPH)